MPAGRRRASSRTGPSKPAGEGRFVAQLSRRVKACDECRRHKIRCNLPANGSPPCDRCVKNGIECQLTKSLQSILDERQSDKAWRTSVENRLEAIVKVIEGGTSVRELRVIMSEEKARSSFDNDEDQATFTSKRKRVGTSRSDSLGGDNLGLGLGLLADAASVENSPMRKKHWEDEELADPAHAPGEHLRQLAPSMSGDSFATGSKSNGLTRKRQPDIIDQGLITVGQANTFVQIYFRHLDDKAWCMVSREHSRGNEADDLVRIRQSSSLLLAAVCTVGSLHCGTELDSNGIMIEPGSREGSTKLHRLLHNEYVRASAQQGFAREQSMDDIRALIIGSLWLRELSWILTASAVRIVTERGMQDSYKMCANMSAGKADVAFKGEEAKISSQSAGSQLKDSTLSPAELQKYYKEAILYYQVHVADHQAAIPFSRPPMTRQHAAVRNARAWLSGCYFTSEEDRRLIADVETWVIAHDIVDDFGVDVHEPLTDHQVLELVPRYYTLIERLKKRWDWHSIYDRLDPVDMLNLLLSAHAFRASEGISPLLFQSQQAVVTLPSLHQDELSDRDSVVMSRVPHLVSGQADAGQARLEMGERAINSALQICINCEMLVPLGEPVYPLVMVIFACLFLNKMARMYDEDVIERDLWSALTSGSGQNLRLIEDRLVLNKGLKVQIVEHMQKVAKHLQAALLSRCVPLHFCASVTASLEAIATDLKARGEAQMANKGSKVTFDGMNGLLPIEQGDVAPFEINLQALDLLSNTRFISGVDDDASLWFHQDWLLTQ